MRLWDRGAWRSAPLGLRRCQLPEAALLVRARDSCSVRATWAALQLLWAKLRAIVGVQQAAPLRVRSRVRPCCLVEAGQVCLRHVQRGLLLEKPLQRRRSIHQRANYTLVYSERQSRLCISSSGRRCLLCVIRHFKPSTLCRGIL